jgi:LuxR family maltose regulon positive regulatory protein
LRLVSRARLVERLNSDAPLTIVRGVGGSGKTVLMADWAHGREDTERPGLWVSLRRQSASRLSFWNEIVDALLDAGIEGDGSPISTVVASFGSTDDPRALLVRALAKLPHGLHLVVDNYDRVGDDDVHGDLIDILEHCADIRVTLATRTTGGVDAAEFAMRVDTEVVGPRDLRFTDRETLELFRQTGVVAEDARAEDALVAAVQNATDGLALPVRAAAIALAGEGRMIEPRDVRIPDSVVTYIAQTVRAVVTDERIRRFLLRSSVPEATTVELARALTGEPDAEDLLVLAEANGLGLWSSGPEGTVFRYSTVVRSALFGELAADLPQEVPELRRRLAVWAQENGMPFTALANAVEADDLDLASRVALDGWVRLLEFNLPETVAVLQGLPLRRIRHFPVLSMVLGLAYDDLGDHRMRAIEMFTLAIAASRMRASKTGPAERFVLVSGESAAYRLTGRYAQAATSAVTALTMFEELSPDARDEVRHVSHYLLGHIGISLLYAGDIDRAMAAFRASYSASTALGELRNQLHSLSLIAGTLALVGEMSEAAEPIRRLDRMDWPDGWRSGYTGSMYRLAKGFQALEDFDAQTAQSHYDAIAPHLGAIEHRGFFLALQALIDMVSLRHRVGAVELQVALDRSAKPELPRVVAEWLACLLALELLSSGRQVRADAVLAPHPSQSPPIALARAIIALLDDDAAEALRLLDGARLRGMGGRRLATCHGLVRAAAMLRLGNEELASDIAEEIVTIMRDCGLRLSVIFVPNRDRAALLANARRHGSRETVEFFEALEAHPSSLPDAQDRVRLTERESTVLRRLVETGSVAEIAGALYVSSNTVKSQLRSLYRKLGVASRDEALLVASEKGLLEG